MLHVSCFHFYVSGAMFVNLVISVNAIWAHPSCMFWLPTASIKWHGGHNRLVQCSINTSLFEAQGAEIIEWGDSNCLSQEMVKHIQFVLECGGLFYFLYSITNLKYHNGKGIVLYLWIRRVKDFACEVGKELCFLAWLHHISIGVCSAVQKLQTVCW